MELKLLATNKSLLAALRATTISNSQDSLEQDDDDDEEDDEDKQDTPKTPSLVSLKSLISSKRWESKAIRRTRSVQSFLKIPPLIDIQTTSRAI